MVSMADSTFDIVSKVDKMEADNALHQAQKEIAQRYDFKNVGASVDWSGEKLLLKANSEERVKAVLEVLEQKFIKRGISLRSLDGSLDTTGAKGKAVVTVCAALAGFELDIVRERAATLALA